MIGMEKKKILSVQSKGLRKKINIESSYESNRKRKPMRSSPIKVVDIDKELEKEFDKTAVEGDASKMEILKSILDILGVNNKGIKYIPKNDYASTVLDDVTCGRFRVVRSLSKSITEGINTLLCPGNPEFQQESKNRIYFVKKFKSNLASITLFGEKDYRIVAQSITTSSF